ncbi:MAG: hypothetical protein AAFX95_26315 [Cyanobacteria bacterium J06639_16]
MKKVLAFGFCFPVVAVGLISMTGRFSFGAELPFETCLVAANGYFRDNTPSQLAAIRACRGTTRPEDVTACIELVDDLWRNSSAAELAGLEACQVQPQQAFEEDPDAEPTGAYATCLRQADESTRSNTASELAAIQACNGLTQPEEVAPCIILAEDLWRDGSDAELTGLAACQVRLY